MGGAVMLQELLDALEPPEAFAPGAPLWNDEHISAQMLLAHLDPDYEGASRGHAFMDRSAEWIAGLLPPARHPRLLDLGCGPGLYAERFQARGYRVTGVDLSARSIEYARGRAAKRGLPIEYRAMDYLALADRARYEAAVLIYCDYGALPPESRAALMGRVYEALAPGGKLLLDAFTPAKLAAFREVRQWESRPRGGFWSGAPYVALQAGRRYPGRVSLEQTVLLEAAGRRAFHIWHQYFTREQLAAEAAAAGFALAGSWDDVAGSDYTGEGETLALLLEKP